MPPIQFDIRITDMVWAGARAFLAALVLTPILRDVFRAYNVVDRPGRRKVHAYPIPRLGGIAIATGYMFGLLVWMRSVGFDRALESPAWQMVPAASVIFLTGVLDDFFTLQPVVKLFGQIAAAGIAVASGLRLDALGETPLPIWVAVPVSVFWLLLTTNALNLIDGLDGLCTSMGLAGAATFLIAAEPRSDTAMQLAAVILGGSLLGFLVHNFNPATIFLGDSGALSIGFLLGCFSLIWARGTGPIPAIAIPLLALSVPLTDVCLAVARRVLTGRSIAAPDRAHLHHRLLDRGWSPRRTVAMLLLWCSLCAAAAYGLTAPVRWTWHLAMLIALVVLVFAGVRQLRYAEFEEAARLIFKREFRRTVQLRARVVQLREALERARTEPEWWQALTDAAAEAGWSAVRWTQSGQTRRGWTGSKDAPGWTFHVALGDQGVVEIEGRSESPESTLDLPACARAIQSSITLRSSAWIEAQVS